MVANYIVEFLILLLLFYIIPMRFMIDLMLIQDNYHTNIIVIFLDKNIELAILHSYILFHFLAGIN